jgi:hypothetical protein
LARLERDELVPASVGVADKAPVDAKDKIEKENKRRHEMEKAHSPKPISEGRLPRDLKRQRPANEKSSGNQNAYT